MSVQNHKEEEFDLFKDNKQKKLKTKHKYYQSFLKWWIIFMSLMSILLIENINFIENYLSLEKKQQQEQVNDFFNVQKAIENGNQQEIIMKFSKLKFDNSYLSDVLSSEIINKNIVTVSNNKITKETKETLMKLYNENWNYGSRKESEELKMLNTCSDVDVICKMDMLNIREFKNKYTSFLKTKNEKLKREIDLKQKNQ